MGISYKCEDYLFSYAKATPPKLDNHRHSYYEFLYFCGGDASYIVENHIYKAEQGDIFVTIPNELHSITFNSEKTYRRYFLQFSDRLLGTVPKQLVSNIYMRPRGERNRIPAEIAAKYRLYDFYYKIERLLENGGKSNDFMVRTYIQQFVVTVNSIPEDEYNDAHKERILIRDIKDYIDGGFDGSLSLDDIARNFFMSKYYLCHIFKAETGMTIGDYINIRRITRAKDLLTMGCSVKDVYPQCGFGEYSSFYRVFKKFTGCTPSEYSGV